MKIALGTFARAGVEAHLGGDVVAGLRLALSDYALRVESGTLPPPIRRPFERTTPAEAHRAPAETPCEPRFELPVDAPTAATLRAEADRQGVTVNRLAAHAVLVYLAELDRLTPSSGTFA